MTVFHGNNRTVFIKKPLIVTSTELVAFNIIPIPVRRSVGDSGVSRPLVLGVD